MGRIPRAFGEMGARSGLFPAQSKMARALERHAAIREKDFSPKMLAGTAPTSIAEVLQRSQLGRADQGSYAVFTGPRNGEPGGVGPRCRVGLLTDGNYGIERWSIDGAHQVGAFA